MKSSPQNSDLCAHGFVKGTVTCLEEEATQTACRKCGTNGKHYCPSDRWDTPENARKEGIEVYSARICACGAWGLDEHTASCKSSNGDKV